MIRLISFDIEITNLCGNGCRFCPRDRITRPMGFMNEEVFREIISTLASFKPFITLSGMGDPLLHPQVFDFISFIRQSGLQVSIVINPNSLDDNKTKKLISSRPNVIKVSFPSVNEQVYNLLNPRSNFNDALSKTLKLIECAKNKVSIKILGTRTKLNQDEVGEFSRFWEGFGVKSVFLDCHTRGGNLEDLTLLDRRTEPNRRICSLFKIHTFIDWQGYILACCHDLSGETKITHVSEGIKDLLERKTEILNTSLKYKKPLFDLCLKCDERLRDLKLPETKNDHSNKSCQTAEYLKSISRINKIKI